MPGCSGYGAVTVATIPGLAGTITREELIRKVIPIEQRFFALAQRHLDSPDRDVRRLANALFLNFERFFIFVDHHGVEPTNNVAERALRHAVIWRKIMMGCRSEAGEVAVARLLTGRADVQDAEPSRVGLSH
jgi:transposase